MLGADMLHWHLLPNHQDMFVLMVVAVVVE
jgi:hypothetical protein